jgi:hypothetical protein
MNVQVSNTASEQDNNLFLRFDLSIDKLRT